MPPIDAYCECPKCYGRWQVFDTPESQPQENIQQNHNILVIETNRSEEFIGEDYREVNNIKSDSEIKRGITVSRSWTQTMVIEYEKGKSNGQELGFTLSNIVNFKTTATESLKTRYQATLGETQTHTEDISIQIPPRTKLRVILKWKRIWQHGEIHFARTPQDIFVIPYRICIGLTFDQDHIEE